jgi:hypothetical protein
MGLTFRLGQLPTSLFTDASNNIGIGAAPSGSYKLEVTGTLGISGLFTSTAFGSSSFSAGGTGYNKLTIRNTTAGAANGAQLSIGTNADPDQFYVQSFATTFTTSGMNIAGGAVVNGEGPGGLSLAATQSNIGFYTNGAGSANLRMTITSAGNVGVGTTPSNGWNERFQVAGNIRVSNTGDPSYYGTLGNPDGNTQLSTFNGGALIFNTTGSEKMRITSGGNVCINGSGFSDVKFYVKGSDATSSNFAALFVNGSASNLFNIRNDGAVQVFGSLSKGSGSFRIEHPLESLSETHQLVHSFIEGPQADLIYRGKLNLVNGKAQANIDEVSTMTEGTFEALCREVQCFTTNESGWDLVKGKVIGNIIYIESQNTNSTDEISWMVIGERKDKHMMDTDWTDENGKVIVEPLKSIQELNERLNKAGL